MQVLLDEDAPEQVIGVLRHLMRGHTIAHVHELGWSGKDDLVLYRDIRGWFDAILTNNYRQLNDPDETKLIKRSGVHHISYAQRVEGLRGLGRAIAAILAAMPAIVAELTTAGGQRLVAIQGLAPKKRYEIIDPRRNPPKYWPR